MTDNCDLCVEVPHQDLVVTMLGTIKGRVPEATLGIAARGEGSTMGTPDHIGS
jgi:hypothetical protein